MGYTTEFQGKFNLKKPLTVMQAKFLVALTQTRRMKRDVNKLQNLIDSKSLSLNNKLARLHEKVGLPLGEDGCNFVGGGGDYGQGEDASVIDHNSSAQHGLWTHWVPTADRKGIHWDGGEKFYNYVEWLQYTITNYLKPWVHVLNGEVRWRGEEFDDMGTITVENNEVTVNER